MRWFHAASDVIQLHTTNDGHTRFWLKLLSHWTERDTIASNTSHYTHRHPYTTCCKVGLKKGGELEKEAVIGCEVKGVASEGKC